MGQPMSARSGDVSQHIYHYFYIVNPKIGHFNYNDIRDIFKVFPWQHLVRNEKMIAPWVVGKHSRQSGGRDTKWHIVHGH